MCGIVGYLGERQAIPVLVDGLRKLEYRGYDSAGVVVPQAERLATVRAEGKLDRLLEKLENAAMPGTAGMGHTRWATHGPPVEKNAHPMLDAKARVAIIHNGIVENFLELKRQLMTEGWKFASDTDTEVVANLISSYLEDDLSEAVARAAQILEGAYAFAVMSVADGDGEIVVHRQGPPLVLGLGDGEQFVASDPVALLPYTQRVVFLENGDLARLTRDRIEVRALSGDQVVRTEHRLNWDPIQAEKGGYKHFMLKEIHDQPQALQDTFAGRVNFERGNIGFESLDLKAADIETFKRIHIVACGTSWHAGLVGKFFIEELAGLPVEVDYGSEYRYRKPIVGPEVLALGISQSGETADTLSAMEAARDGGAKLLALCNVRNSQATRVSDGVIYTHAGLEIGVASTKAFTTQLLALYQLALYLRERRGMKIRGQHLRDMAHLPQAVNEVLQAEARMEALARKYFRAEDFLYLGRGINYPVALEGALKLKEISYIHAEGYPAGEMKHGPIALIDGDLPVVGIATGDRVFDKVKSNLQEVKAREGTVIVLTDHPSEDLEGVADEIVQVPRVSELLQPILNVIPLQLLAYFIGVRRGADVDQPRNLAKSVTVE